ncbi:MAG TPA: ATP-binding cassette domain-containing protein [bacterium]|nr:ATP-binding cassette domain-containing protein [bacterium]
MLIQAFHLTKVHSSGVKVLDDANFSAPEGSFTAVIGESRTGKSTFLKMLGGEDRPTSGVLRVDHKDIYALTGTAKQEWLSEVGMIFPDLALFPDKTVGENIKVILEAKGSALEGSGEAIFKLLSRAGLGAKVDAKPEALSSGERGMVLALRAMIFRPRLLLADDPFQGLDEKAVATLFKLFLELHKAGSTIVLSTQQKAFLTESKKTAGDAVLSWVKLEKGKVYPLEEVLP